MEKTPLKKTVSSPASSDRLLFLALVVSLLVNAYLLFYKKSEDRLDQVLVTADGQTFRWRDISVERQKVFRQLDNSYYMNLKFEAERWAESFVLPKEAAARGVSIGELLKTEVVDKVTVDPQETQKRYALSPAADTLPWPDALNQIETDIRAQRVRESRAEYLEGLFKRYGVKFAISPPASYDAQADLPSRFPVYEPPPAGGDVSAQGWVVGVPSRGPANAPVVIEVYSDFHCPFSRRFAGTLGELQKQYPAELRVLFRHFPLPMHAGAPLAHEASACAQEKGKFWEYHDRLMASEENLDKDGLLKLAGELGLDAGAFQNCVETRKYKPWVEREIGRGQSAGVTGTPGFLVNGRLAWGAMPAESLKPLVEWYLNPVDRYPGPTRSPAQVQGDAPQPPQQPQQPGLDPSKQYPLSADWLKKGPSKGPGDAPVTVVEFFDYNCPFCQKGAEISDQILAKYPGKVRIVPKHLPLPMHPNAQKTSEALLCAHEQGKFWEFRKEIFGPSWGKQSAEDMKAVAKTLRLDAGRFASCLDGSKMTAAVEEDKAVISAIGQTGTPTFFVNGTPVVGAQPIESFQKVIDDKLAGS